MTTHKVIQELHRRRISFHPIYRDVVGSITGALLLSQLMYWFGKKNRIYKTDQMFRDEIRLSEAEMKAAKKQIKDLPFITVTREGIPAKTYYEINYDVYSSYVTEIIEKISTEKDNDTVGLISPNCMGENDIIKLGEIHPCNTYTTHKLHKESTEVDSSLREQDLKHSVDTTVQKKRKALSQPKASVDKAVTKEPLVSKAVRLDTIEILEYWNSFDSLTTHGIARKRNISPLHKQIQAVQKFDCQLYKILNGRFYKGFTTLSVGIRSKKSTKYDIKKAIKRLALAASHEYGVYKKRPRIDCLFHNDRATLGSGKNRHLHLYPFLHFMSNDPVSIADTPTRKKTEYDILVQRTLDGLVSSKTVNDKEYNQAVVQIEKAMVFIKKVSNGNFAENRMRLPKMIIDSMIEDGKTLNVQNLPLGVYNLERYMRKRLMIK